MELPKDLRRALRRHHVARLKRTRAGYWGRSSLFSEALSPRQLGMLVRTTTPCNCWMCGNPRRKRWLADKGHGLTIQEIVQHNYADSFNDDSDQ